MYNYRIVNVVMTSNLNQHIDLLELSKRPNIIFDICIYGGRVAYYKSDKMLGKVTIFPSGKLISVGTTSEKRAVQELKMTADYLIEEKFIASVPLSFKVQNIVVTALINIPINYECLVYNFGLTYNPEEFPAGILKINEPSKITALIFSSGKLILTGLRSENHIIPSIDRIASILRYCAESKKAQAV